MPVIPTSCTCIWFNLYSSLQTPRSLNFGFNFGNYEYKISLLNYVLMYLPPKLIY